LEWLIPSVKQRAYILVMLLEVDASRELREARIVYMRQLL
jgi:hypothetical protein